MRFKRFASMVFLGLGLTLTLLWLLSVLSHPTHARRLLSIGGSTVTSDHAFYQNDAPNVYSITVHNASGDGEYLDGAQITFPDEWIVTATVQDADDSGGHPVSFSTSGIGTRQVTFTDDDGDLGEIAPDCSWNAVVTVTAPMSVTGNQTVTWSLSGDEFWASELPHDITGTYVIRFWLTVSPTALHFNAIEGTTNPPSQNVSILNYGSELVNWQVSAEPVPWLKVSPPYGKISPTQDSSLTVSTIISGLTIGEYTDTIRISGQSAQLEVPVTLRVVLGMKVYLPLVLRGWPPIPGTPELLPITAPGDNVSYLVEWGAADQAVTYTLQEATVSNFPDAKTEVIYTGGDTSWSVASEGMKRYYYRVKAHNQWGDSGWSNAQSVQVRWEKEINDNAQTQANGPIVSGLTYYGIFPADDPKDYFYFDLSSAHSVELWLTNIAPGEDYDVYLRDASLSEVGKSAESGNVDEHIPPGVLSPGRYYIQVYNDSASGSTQPYHLRVVYQ